MTEQTINRIAFSQKKQGIIDTLKTRVTDTERYTPIPETMSYIKDDCLACRQDEIGWFMLRIISGLRATGKKEISLTDIKDVFNTLVQQREDESTSYLRDATGPFGQPVSQTKLDENCIKIQHIEAVQKEILEELEMVFNRCLDEQQHSPSLSR